MKVVLIIIYLSHGIATAEFNNIDDCRWAGDSLKATLPDHSIVYVCKPKGED